MWGVAEVGGMMVGDADWLDDWESENGFGFAGWMRGKMTSFCLASAELLKRACQDTALENYFPSRIFIPSQSCQIFF